MHLSIAVLLLAYVGCILTIVSPYILPMLPFVFARNDQPFWRNGLPMLGGMIVTFAAVASLAAATGGWAVRATMVSPTGHIAYRFHARDLHLVLSTSSDSKQVRFRVTIDGKAPGSDHGMDVDANGDGTINGQRLYQLIRQKRKVQDHVFQIEFLDSGAQAYAFTFG